VLDNEKNETLFTMHMSLVLIVVFLLVLLLPELSGRCFFVVFRPLSLLFRVLPTSDTAYIDTLLYRIFIAQTVTISKKIAYETCRSGQDIRPSEKASIHSHQRIIHCFY